MVLRARSLYKLVRGNDEVESEASVLFREMAPDCFFESKVSRVKLQVLFRSKILGWLNSPTVWLTL